MENTLNTAETRWRTLSAAKDAEIANLRGILNALFEPLNHDEVASRAYSYAQQRGFQGGSPGEDWLRAERDAHFGRLTWAWECCRRNVL